MRTTPTSVLLSEAGEPPLFQLLRERAAAGRLRLLPSRIGLFSSYLSVLGLVDGRHRTRRPSSFDVPWGELSFGVDLDLDWVPGRGSSAAGGTPSALSDSRLDTSPGFIFTDF